MSEGKMPERNAPVKAKEFRWENFRLRPSHESGFQPVWPRFQQKEYSPQFDRHLREMEAKVLKQAKEKALLIEKEAYEKGFAQGERDGIALGEKRLENVLTQFRKALVGIEEERKTLYRRYERDMVEVVLSIARKVLHLGLEEHDETILKTLQESFRFVIDRNKVLVRLNPTDYQYLQSHRVDLPPELANPEGMTLIEDASISRGGCRLETSFGEIDGTVEGQFEEIVCTVWRTVNETGLLGERSST